MAKERILWGRGKGELTALCYCDKVVPNKLVSVAVQPDRYAFDTIHLFA